MENFADWFVIPKWEFVYDRANAGQLWHTLLISVETRDETYCHCHRNVRAFRFRDVPVCRSTELSRAEAVPLPDASRFYFREGRNLPDLRDAAGTRRGRGIARK